MKLTFIYPCGEMKEFNQQQSEVEKQDNIDSHKVQQIFKKDI